MNRPHANANAHAARELHGLVVIDKKPGLTSHDIVHRIRKKLGEKRIGHAGTLDPMASGVLVVLLGEATKLSAYFTAHDKHYETIVALGAATNTLDAEGEITERAELSAELRAEIQRLSAALTEGPASDAYLHSHCPVLHAALAAERARTSQIPPAFSAIKIEGRKSYDLARKGEEIEHAPRPVRVHSLELLPLPAHFSSGPETSALLRFSMAVSKGYYVRSFARDFGAALPAPAHLAALRRTQSGPFTLEHAVSEDANAGELKAALIPLDQAALTGLRGIALTPSGEQRARHGKQLSRTDFCDAPPEDGESFAWLGAAGHLVAIGHHDGEAFRVQRGFTPAPSSANPSTPTASPALAPRPAAKT